mgnify:FL=1
MKKFIISIAILLPLSGVGIYKGIEYKKAQEVIRIEKERKAAEAEKAWKDLNRAACEKLFEKCKIEYTPEEEKQLLETAFSFERTKALLLLMCDARLEFWQQRLAKVHNAQDELEALIGRYTAANGGIVSRYDTTFNETYFKLRGYEDKAKTELENFKKQRVVLENARMTDGF